MDPTYRLSLVLSNLPFYLESENLYFTALIIMIKNKRNYEAMMFIIYFVSSLSLCLFISISLVSCHIWGSMTSDQKLSLWLHLWFDTCQIAWSRNCTEIFGWACTEHRNQDKNFNECPYLSTALAPSVRGVPNYILAGYIYNTVGTHRHRPGWGALVIRAGDSRGNEMIITVDSNTQHKNKYFPTQ